MNYVAVGNIDIQIFINRVRIKYILGDIHLLCKKLLYMDGSAKSYAHLMAFSYSSKKISYHIKGHQIKPTKTKSKEMDNLIATQDFVKSGFLTELPFEIL